MNKITFEDYKSGIEVKYEVSKIDDVYGILLNLTPVQLRNLCLMKLIIAYRGPMEIYLEYSLI